jgi:hypothetical protein
MTPMDDPTPQPDRPADLVCPWCSTIVTPETEKCPNCGAVLIGDEEPVLPGVTAVDEKVVRGETRPVERNRLLSWISGEYAEEEATEALSQAIAPPDPEVKREIRRLEIEAEVANLTAEVQARRVEAVADVIDEGDPDEAQAAVAALEAVEADDDAEVEAVVAGLEAVDAEEAAAVEAAEAEAAAGSEPGASSDDVVAADAAPAGDGAPSADEGKPG